MLFQDTVRSYKKSSVFNDYDSIFVLNKPSSIIIVVCSLGIRLLLALELGFLPIKWCCLSLFPLVCLFCYLTRIIDGGHVKHCHWFHSNLYFIHLCLNKLEASVPTKSRGNLWPQFGWQWALQESLTLYFWNIKMEV